VPEGHFPVMFAEIAHCLIDLGCEVTVLTAQGWALQDAQHRPRFGLEQLTGVDALLYRGAQWLALRPPRSITRILKRLVFDTVVTLAANRKARQLGADVIVTTVRPRPYVVLALASNARWLVFQFTSRGRGRIAWTDQQWVSRLLAAREARRRRRGGGVILAVNNENFAESWRSGRLGAEVRRLAFTGARDVEPRPDARTRLGIDPSWRIALVFGAGRRDHKRFDAVFEAFAQLEASNSHADWHLLVVGAMASNAKEWQQAHGVTLQRVHLIPGYVSEEQRALVHAAADVVVLSFAPGFNGDSGTLADAISWGLPVLCADGSQPSKLVRQLGVGVGFDGSSSDAFIAALTSVPLELSESARRNALDHFGMRTATHAFLEALDSLGDRRP